MMRSEELNRLDTERRNPKTMELDKMSALEIASVMNAEDLSVVAAIKDVLPRIAEAIELTSKCLLNRGRIIYIGAGTSGRLGALDAAECPPTFGVSDETVIGLIAGGDSAFKKAVEGAEDSTTLCEKDLRDIGLTSDDIVIGLAASGRTPYVLYGLRYANSIGCRTIAIACSKDSVIGKSASLAIEPATGPEVLTGSTRLKAGTAQKMILNMISTGSMVRAGKVYENLMVDVQPTNEKLQERAVRIVTEATGCDRERAKEVLTEAAGEVKTAIVMLLLGLGCEDARKKLDENGGFIRKVIS